MAAPHVLSDDFQRYIQDLEQKIETLTSQLDVTTAQLDLLTDRFGGLATSPSVFMLPAKVIGGDRFEVTVSFPGELNPKNWPNAQQEFEGTGLSFLLNINDPLDPDLEDDDIVEFTIPNIINGMGETPPPGSGVINHNLDTRHNDNAIITPQEMKNSAVPVYLFLGIPQNVQAWGSFAGQRIAGYPALTYAKPENHVGCI